MEGRMRSPGTMHRLRAGFGLAGLVLAAFLAAWIGGLLPTSVVGTAGAVALGAAATLVVSSVVEWLVHRHVYHRGRLRAFARLRDIHHRVHHHVFFPTWRYVTSGPPRRIPLRGNPEVAATTGWANAAIALVHSAFYLALALVFVVAPLGLLSRRPAFLAGSLAAALVVSDLMVRVHDVIHRPGSHPLVERQPWFPFLDRHHFIHHADTDANVNFLLPLGDLVAGTLRTALTAEEVAAHGTLAQAKTSAVGRGEPARESRRIERRRAVRVEA
jgi:hypothetical protein